MVGDLEKIILRCKALYRTVYNLLIKLKQDFGTQERDLILWK